MTHSSDHPEIVLESPDRKANIIGAVAVSLTIILGFALDNNDIRKSLGLSPKEHHEQINPQTIYLHRLNSINHAFNQTKEKPVLLNNHDAAYLIENIGNMLLITKKDGDEVLGIATVSHNGSTHYVAGDQIDGLSIIEQLESK